MTGESWTAYHFQNCPLCGSRTKKEKWPNEVQRIHYWCEVCGKYVMTDQAALTIGPIDVKAKLCLYLSHRRDKETDEYPLTALNVHELAQSVELPQTDDEMIFCLLHYLNDKFDESRKLRSYNAGVIGLINPRLIHKVVKLAEQRKLIIVREHFDDGYLLEITGGGIEYVEAVETKLNISEEDELLKSPTYKGFIVHGHDRGFRYEVKSYIGELIEHDQRLYAKILHEEANAGDTLVEKFERHAQCDFAVVLMTSDDLGCQKADAHDKDKWRKRTRQNVWFEAGFFFGRIGRDRVIVLYEDEVEIPTDVAGLVYVPLSGQWKDELRREIHAIYEKLV